MDTNAWQHDLAICEEGIRIGRHAATMDQKPPELMDVPAINGDWILGSATNGHYPEADMACRIAKIEMQLETEMRPDGCYIKKPGSWTCADKSRILLTAEDGTKHCVKFPNSPRASLTEGRDPEAPRSGDAS